MGKTCWYSIGFVAWMIFITWASLATFSSNDIPSFRIPHLDKAVHFTFYFVAVMLGIMCVRENNVKKYSLVKSVWTMALFLVVFGIIIEVIQYKFSPNRMGDLYDGLANSIGAFTGAWVMKTLFSGKWGLNWGQ